jgi:hypothetical protein
MIARRGVRRLWLLALVLLAPGGAWAKESDDLRGSARLTLGGDAGSLPSLVAGVRGAFDLEMERYLFEAGVGYWFPSSALLTTSPDSGGRFQLTAFSLRSCFLPLSSIKLGLCFAGELGELSGSGIGTATPSDQHSFWAALGDSAELRLPLAGKLALVLDAGVVIPLLRPRFVIPGVGDVFRSGVIAARFGAGLSLEIF